MESYLSTQSWFLLLMARKATAHGLLSSPSLDPPYPVYGGIFREEAITLLRRFYVQQNEKGERNLESHPRGVSGSEKRTAPDPRPKKNRQLIEVRPLNMEVSEPCSTL